MNITKQLKRISYGIFGLFIALLLPMAVYYGIEYIHTPKQGIDPANELGALFREKYEFEKKLEKFRTLQCSLIDTKECDLVKHADTFKDKVALYEKKFLAAQLAYDKKAIELDNIATAAEKTFFSKIFRASIITAILAFAGSTFISIAGISIGFAIGAIFTLIMGGYSYWDYLHPGLKFMTIFILFILLTSLSYRISKLRNN